MLAPVDVPEQVAVLERWLCACACTPHAWHRRADGVYVRSLAAGGPMLAEGLGRAQLDSGCA